MKKMDGKKLQKVVKKHTYICSFNRIVNFKKFRFFWELQNFPQFFQKLFSKNDLVFYVARQLHFDNT